MNCHFRPVAFILFNLPILIDTAPRFRFDRCPVVSQQPSPLIWGEMKLAPTEPQGVSALSTGTVKWFNEQKGYGFIEPDEGGKDLFIHYSNIQSDGFRTLTEGQKVEYVAGEGRKGPEATQVRPC